MFLHTDVLKVRRKKAARARGWDVAGFNKCHSTAQRKVCSFLSFYFSFLSMPRFSSTQSSAESLWIIHLILFHIGNASLLLKHTRSIRRAPPSESSLQRRNVYSSDLFTSAPPFLSSINNEHVTADCNEPPTETLHSSAQRFIQCSRGVHRCITRTKSPNHRLSLLLSFMSIYFCLFFSSVLSSSIKYIMFLFSVLFSLLPLFLSVVF